MNSDDSSCNLPNVRQTSPLFCKANMSGLKSSLFAHSADNLARPSINDVSVNKLSSEDYCPHPLSCDSAAMMVTIRSSPRKILAEASESTVHNVRCHSPRMTLSYESLTDINGKQSRDQGSPRKVENEANDVNVICDKRSPGKVVNEAKDANVICDAIINPFPKKDEKKLQKSMPPSCHIGKPHNRKMNRAKDISSNQYVDSSKGDESSNPQQSNSGHDRLSGNELLSSSRSSECEYGKSNLSVSSNQRRNSIAQQVKRHNDKASGVVKKGRKTRKIVAGSVNVSGKVLNPVVREKSLPADLKQQTSPLKLTSITKSVDSCYTSYVELAVGSISSFVEKRPPLSNHAYPLLHRLQLSESFVEFPNRDAGDTNVLPGHITEQYHAVRPTCHLLDGEPIYSVVDDRKSSDSQRLMVQAASDIADGSALQDRSRILPDVSLFGGRSHTTERVSGDQVLRLTADRVIAGQESFPSPFVEEEVAVEKSPSHRSRRRLTRQLRRSSISQWSSEWVEEIKMRQRNEEGCQDNQYSIHLQYNSPPRSQGSPHLKSIESNSPSKRFNSIEPEISSPPSLLPARSPSPHPTSSCRSLRDIMQLVLPLSPRYSRKYQESDAEKCSSSQYQQPEDDYPLIANSGEEFQACMQGNMLPSGSSSVTSLSDLVETSSVSSSSSYHSVMSAADASMETDGSDNGDVHRDDQHVKTGPGTSSDVFKRCRRGKSDQVKNGELTAAASLRLRRSSVQLYRSVIAEQVRKRDSDSCSIILLDDDDEDYFVVADNSSEKHTDKLQLVESSSRVVLQDNFGDGTVSSPSSSVRRSPLSGKLSPGCSPAEAVVVPSSPTRVGLLNEGAIVQLSAGITSPSSAGVRPLVVMDRLDAEVAVAEGVDVSKISSRRSLLPRLTEASDLDDGRRTSGRVRNKKAVEYSAPSVVTTQTKKKAGKRMAPEALEDLYRNRLWREQMPKERTWELIPESPLSGPKTSSMQPVYFGTKKLKCLFSFDDMPSKQKLKKRHIRAVAHGGWRPATARKRRAAIDELFKKKMEELDRSVEAINST